MPPCDAVAVTLSLCPVSCPHTGPSSFSPQHPPTASRAVCPHPGSPCRPAPRLPWHSPPARAAPPGCCPAPTGRGLWAGLRATDFQPTRPLPGKQQALSERASEQVTAGQIRTRAEAEASPGNLRLTRVKQFVPSGTQQRAHLPRDGVTRVTSTMCKAAGHISCDSVFRFKGLASQRGFCRSFILHKNDTPPSLLSPKHAELLRGSASVVDVPSSWDPAPQRLTQLTPPSHLKLSQLTPPPPGGPSDLPP